VWLAVIRVILGVLPAQSFLEKPQRGLDDARPVGPHGGERRCRETPLFDVVETGDGDVLGNARTLPSGLVH